MRAMSLRSKTHAVPAVVAAGLSVVGVGLVSDGMVMADATSVTDTINVTVQPSCTFNSGTSDKNYAGSAVNGAEVNNFNDDGEHVFNLFCNNNSGFTVSARAYNLVDANVQSANIAYTDNYTPSGENSLWTAGIVSSPASLAVRNVVPAGEGGVIIQSDTNTPAAGVSFTAAYRAYVGSATPAGTYTGTIVYTLAPTGSTNSGSNSQQNANQNNSNSGTGGNEEPTSQEPGSTTGGSEQGNQGTGGSNTDTPANTDSTPKTASLMTTNNDYSTHNTYNTTNYSGGSSATPVVSSPAPALAATSEDGKEVANNNEDGSNDSYEKPLGVTTTKSSDKSSSGLDPVPIVVAGMLATAGLAGVALVKSGNKEEN